jgi:hypothetical protein
MRAKIEVRGLRPRPVSRRRRRRPVALATALCGASCAYLFDPASGRRRRRAAGERFGVLVKQARKRAVPQLRVHDAAIARALKQLVEKERTFSRTRCAGDGKHHPHRLRLARR